MSDPLAALRAVSGNDPSSGATTLPNIPAVPYTDDASLTNILSAMKLWMDKAAGSGLTGFASKQDLIDAGVLTKDPSGNLKPTADTSMAVPPVPTGLTASGAMTIILLEWDDPRLAYSNHGYTEIWAAEVDNFSSAQLVGQSSGAIFVHAVGEGTQRYYWIRFVSTAGVMGPYNAVGGTLGQTAQNPAYLLDAMSGILDEQPFFTVETPTEINGVTIPVGTYMKSAFIHDAFITSAMIYELSADKITTGTLAAGRIATNSITADKINGTNLAVVNGTFSGSLQAATGTFTGALSAATGTFAGRLTAGTIDPGAFAGRVYTYGTPGTYTVTVPTGTGWSAVNMRFVIQGAGGGGGSGTASANNRVGCSGGGGGAGASITVTLANVSPGSTYTLVVGYGGSGAPVNSLGASSGGNGGSTSLAGYYANGGGGGTGGDPYAPSGGTGPLGSPKYGVRGVGGSLGGQNGNVDNVDNFVPGGAGGSSAYGSGGGSDASGGVGAGGGGGSTGPGDIDRGGAPGGNGYAIIEFFDPNAVVTNTRYQNLITWLDGVGHGAVPANAR
jgi:hypothetical protein